MARAAGGRVLSPGVPGEGMNPFVIDKGDSEELLQRIGSLRRLIEVMVGESLGAERRASLDHALAGYYAQPRERTGFRDFYKYLQEDEAGDAGLARLLQAIRHRQPASPALRRGRRPARQRGPRHRLRPAPLGAGAAAGRRDGLHRDGVGGGSAGPQAPAAGRRRGVVDHAAPRRRGLHGVVWRSGRGSTAWDLQFITQDVQDLLSEDTSRTITGHSGRALLQNAAFKLLLQQDAAAISTVGDAFDLPVELQRWLLSCPQGRRVAVDKGQPLPRPHRGHPGGDGGHRVAARTPLEIRERTIPHEAEPEEHPVWRRRRKEGSRPAGGDAAKDRGAHPARRREPAPVRRRSRTLLPGAGRGHGRRHPDGPLPRRPGGARPALRPLPPGPYPAGWTPTTTPCARARASRRGPSPSGRTAPSTSPCSTFRDDDLLDPGSDPLIALMGALSVPLRGGARGGAAAAALPGPRLVAGTPGQGPQAARHGAAGTRLHVPDQAPPDWTA